MFSENRIGIRVLDPKVFGRQQKKPQSFIGDDRILPSVIWASEAAGENHPVIVRGSPVPSTRRGDQFSIVLLRGR
jgi:hypothetical protein